MKLRSLVVALLLMSGLFQTDSVASTEPVLPYIVHDIPAALLTERGATVVDDYGIYVHAKLTQSLLEQLHAEGYVYEEFHPAISRAGWNTTDDIPLHLRALPGTSYYVVQYRGPVKAGWISGLVDAGASIIEILPPAGYLVRATPLVAESLRAKEQVVAVSPYHPAFKLSTDLPRGEGEFNATVVADKAADLGLLLQRIALAGADRGAFTTSFSRHILDVRLTPQEAIDVARIDEVLWIERSWDGAGRDAEQSSAIIQTGSFTQYDIHSYGVNGSTQKIVTCDGGLETVTDHNYTTKKVIWVKHAAFNRTTIPLFDAQLTFQPHLQSPVPTVHPDMHIVMYYAPRENEQDLGDHELAPSMPNTQDPGHGTKATGVLLGDTPSYGVRNGYDGIAFASKLMFCDDDINNVQQIPNNYWSYFEPAYLSGATIASMSTGPSLANPTYTEVARQADEIVWNNRTFTILRAVGNTGTVAGQRAESVAKSVLSVGATENHACGTIKPTLCQSSGDVEKVSEFSSRGPAGDGRFKPNVVAPGWCVNVYALGGSTTCSGGTSFAAPGAAGAGSLVRDYFAKGFYPDGWINASNTSHERSNVSAALVRAMLMVSGHDLLNQTKLTFPNGDEGWGRVHLNNSLYFDNESRKLLIVDEWESNTTGHNLTTGEYWERFFDVHDTGEVRVFLAWTDFPGTVGTTKAIINDLDLRVTGPMCDEIGAIVEYICIGNAFAPGTMETDPGKENPADRLNVEEAVYRCNWPTGTPPCNVATGRHLVRVRAHNVTTIGGQSFGLAITGNVTWA